MLYNIMKRASVPNIVNEGVKNLPPIFLKSAENLHEELSEYLPIKLDKNIISRQSNLLDIEVDDELREFIYNKFSESNKHTGYAL